jgi:hypothetical protein
MCCTVLVVAIRSRNPDCSFDIQPAFHTVVSIFKTVIRGYGCDCFVQECLHVKHFCIIPQKLKKEYNNEHV